MADNTTQTPDSQSEGGGFNLMRIVYIAFGVLVGLFLLILALAVWGAATQVERFGPVIQVIRDIMIILLALEGILIVLALVVLIAQIARLVNLLQTEIRPILKNTQETVQHAKGTVEFVGKNLTEPVITVNKFMVTAGVFAREIFSFQRLLARGKTATAIQVEKDKDTDKDGKQS